MDMEGMHLTCSLCNWKLTSSAAERGRSLVFLINNISYGAKHSDT